MTQTENDGLAPLLDNNIITEQEAKTIEKAEELIYEDRARDFFSVSELNTFMVCPLKHRIKYEYGIKLEDISKSLVFGDLVHKAIAQYYKLAWKNQSQNLNVLLASFEEELVKSSETLDKVTETDKEKQSFKLSGLSCLSEFHKRVRVDSIKSNPLTYQPKGLDKEIPAVELELKVPIVNLFSEEKEKITDLYMLSYIDLISESKGKHVTIWDHKTAQREWPTFKIETDIQLPAYAYAFRYELLNGRFAKHSGQMDLERFYKEDKCGYHFIFKGKEPKVKVTSSPIEDWRIQLFFEIIKRFIKAKEQDTCIPTFNYDYYKGCGNCPFHIPCGKRYFNKDKSLCYQYLRGAKKDDLHQLAKEIRDEGNKTE